VKNPDFAVCRILDACRSSSAGADSHGEEYAQRSGVKSARCYRGGLVRWNLGDTVEQGNRDQAQYHLSRIAAICGASCEEYRSLAAALEKPPGTGLIY
jgi:hypothetical protein